MAGLKMGRATKEDIEAACLEFHPSIVRKEDVDKWTHIGDELPSDGPYVLAWSPDGGGRIECAFRSLGVWYFRPGCVLDNVTHWKELPQPPSGE